MVINKEQLKNCIPKISDVNLEKYLIPLNTTLEKFNINTSQRICNFLAQVTHESNSFIAVVENLNYSAKGLLQIFPKYFTQENVAFYAHNPEKIANKVYSNRMNNGDEKSGDGWRYKGRGPIQMTGKTNYQSLSAYFNIDFVHSPELLELPINGCLAAGWFWYSRELNKLADINTEESLKQITKKINGGYNGLEDRVKNWNICKKALNIN